MKDNSEKMSVRISKKLKKFIKKRAEQMGGIKKYHLSLYEKDGYKITAEDF